MKLRANLPNIIAWALSGVISFFALSFFQNFYTSYWALIFFTVLLNTVFTLVFAIVLETVISRLKEKIIPIAILCLGVLLFPLTLRLLNQYPTLLGVALIPARNTIPTFLVLTILSSMWTIHLIHKLDSTNWRSSTIAIWIKRNFPGLLLASAISASAYALGTTITSPDLHLADNYFDTDSPIWVNFLTANRDQVMSMRAVHPYALMLLRPQVWLLSILMYGDKFHATILLNALYGGACVFLAWLFFKRRTNNTTYALIIAALLGLSNSHLLLSSFLESYIFSAAMLVASVVILQNKDAKLIHVIPVGLITFGITITNFIQTCITFFLTQWSIKKTFKYVSITIVLATILTFTQTLLQPNSQPFYIPSNIGNESVFKREVVGVPLSETISRVNVITRTMTLFSVVAPRPLILLEEIGCSTPCFNTIRFFRGEYQYASYIGFGSWLARLWFLLLVIAALIFIWNLFRNPRNSALQAALVLNLLFNFVLHMNYGDDPMLYSPNWTYALVFFVGISYEKMADKKWFQVGLLIFLTALLFNNVELFHKILDAILPFFG
ncbi:MAG: hypothetical protein IPP66_06475 [Anaerolineales bacterium]|nr:hypothetical protein [Anaerolineales bacterium]